MASTEVLADFAGYISPAKDELTQLAQRARQAKTVENWLKQLLEKPVEEDKAAKASRKRASSMASSVSTSGARRELPP